MLDIDHIENPMEVWYKLREDKELMERIALVHITSSSYGIRIVAAADVETGNLADNQIALAQKLGYKADESCIDATRNSFAPKEEDTQLYRQKKTQPLYHEFASGSEKNNFGTDYTDLHELSCKTLDEDATKNPCNSCNPCQKIKWRGYDLQSIIDARYGDRLPCAEDTNRHTESLKLATDLLLMLDGDKQRVQEIVEAQPWVQEIIAERDENVAQTVESAASCIAEKEKRSASPMPSKAMQEAVRKVAGRLYREVVDSRSEECGVRSENTSAADSALGHSSLHFCRRLRPWTFLTPHSSLQTPRKTGWLGG